MKKIIQVTLLSLLTVIFFKAEASHLMGGQITYTWVSGNTYTITGTLYRDCAGVSMPSSMYIAIAGAASPTSVTLPRISLTDVSILCPGQVSRCSGGTEPGIQEGIFQANVTLPTAALYTFSWSDCCRNGAISTLNPSTMYLSAQLNTLAAPGNSSPDFLNRPIGDYCTGNPTSLSPNGADANGDVIVYSLVDARVSATSSVSYYPGFSGLNPLTSSTPIVINPNTGVISFTPSSPSQVAVMAFRAEEYRVINNVSTKIGEVYRDIQVRIGSCGGNAAPVLSAVPNAIVQVGQNYCVNINATDGPTQNITLSAVSSIIPPATFNITSSGPGFTNSTFCFTPTAVHQGNTYTVSVNAQDDVCDSVTTSVRTWNITVPAAVCNVSISSSSTNETCGLSDGTATANLVGGTAPYVYSWTGPGGYTSFSGPTITGLASGTYNVNISDAGNCAETASIIVGDNCGNACATTNTFTPMMTSGLYAGAGANDPETYYWGLSTGFIKANPAGGSGSYSYSWSNSAGYMMKGVSNMKGRLWYPTGPTWVKVAITDLVAGCTIEDSVYIDWVDFTCNQPDIWFYEMCNTVTNSTVCIASTRNMKDSVKTGNYMFGPCVTPKISAIAQSELGVNIFPNPNNGEFTYIVMGDDDAVYNTEVLDLNGRILFSESFTSTSTLTSREISLQGFAAGFYMIKVSSNNTSTVERIIIQ